MKHGWTQGQYSLWRFALGMYFVELFVALLPWGTEQLSNQGINPSPRYELFPNLLIWLDAPAAITAVLVVAIVVSVAVAVGFHDRKAALLLWYIHQCVLERGGLSIPGSMFLNWLLIAHMISDPAPMFSWAHRKRGVTAFDWKLDPRVFRAAWVVLAASYTTSGLLKISAPSWRDGSALTRIVDFLPLARDTLLRDVFITLPLPATIPLTWLMLAMEILALPVAYFARGRKLLWFGLTLMHVSLLFLMDIFEISAAMLVVHLFCLDPAWIRARAPEVTATLRYRPRCGFAHGWVRFLLAEDRNQAFKFVPTDEIEGDWVLHTSDGEALTGAEALAWSLGQLGGLWRPMGFVARKLPARLTDALVSSLTARAGEPASDRPEVPAELEARFVR